MIAARIIPIRAGRPKGEDFYRPSIEYTRNGNLLCYDAYGGRWFRSSKEAVENAIELFIEEYKDGNALNYNDLYALLGISQTDFGSQYGWSSSDSYQIHMEFHVTYLSADDLKSGSKGNDLKNTFIDILFVNNFEEGILIIRPDVNSLPFESYWEV